MGIGICVGKRVSTKIALCSLLIIKKSGKISNHEVIKIIEYSKYSPKIVKQQPNKYCLDSIYFKIK